MLEVHEISKPLEERHRREWLGQSTLESPPMAAVQILGDKHTTGRHSGEETGEGVDNVARMVRATFDDDICSG